MANECIPLYTPGATVTAQTTTAVVGKTFVALTGAMAGGLPKVGTATAAGAKFGVAVRDAASGGRVPVIRAKGVILPVTAGAAIAALAEVEIGSNGQVVTKNTGIAVGKALDAASGAGVDVFIELY
jgi:hypothetical protein